MKKLLSQNQTEQLSQFDLKEKISEKEMIKTLA